MSTVDLILFMGQSNMAGRGNAALAPIVPPFAGSEFRPVTDPEQLFPIREPFGENENNPGGVYEPGMKSGSLVSAFVLACYSATQVPIVGVSCSKGGSRIHEWMPGAPYFADALQRYQAAKAFLCKNHITVRHTAIAWCQGCSDGCGNTSAADYRSMTEAVLNAFFEQGVAACFFIAIGHHRDIPGAYDEIRAAQYALCAAHPNIHLVSDQFKTLLERGMMKDEYHYTQDGYNLIGYEAGANAARILAGL